MSENPFVATTPVFEHIPAGDTLPEPTPEQQNTADQLFTQTEERHAAADLLGMVAATQLLHDLATDMFQVKHEDEEDETNNLNNTVEEEPVE